MQEHKLVTLQRKIGYVFENQKLILQALTHRSANKSHNERLEFLGDAVLGLIIAEILYQKFPKQPEGKLTRMRASLVNRTTLASIARELSLGEMLKLGSGEMKSGGNRRDSILSDTVEAILGAIYLDSGLAAVQESVNILFRSRVDKLDPSVQIKDSKTQLQEYLQSRQIPLPEYQVVSISGKDHAQTFQVKCSISSLGIEANGKGQSRRIAEQEAAKQALEGIQL
ncbi:ribonuclease III [Agaribacter flavus]|uniref:Ribonuclease 3 n=1 Tax=Agaribacter flavus TaxID=1902781 RepID=A0ABV7FPS9_9ALTE